MDLKTYFEHINFDLLIDLCINELKITNKLILDFLKNTQKSLLENFIIIETEKNRVEVLVEILKDRKIIKENDEDVDTKED